MKIATPKQFDRDSLLPFFQELDSYRNESIVTIDFSPLTYAKPTATLVAGTKIKEWVSHRASNLLTSYLEGISDQNQAHTYLMHVGFFDYIGKPVGKRIGEAAGNQNYLPIKRISIPEFNAIHHNTHTWHELISEEASSLARVLVRDHQQDEEIKTYSYCLRELIRNVFEHSGAHECFIFGQRWSNGHAEIVVVDAGKGILASLSQTYDLDSDGQALDFALQPGVSRTSHLPTEENIFDNSGFGLYVLSSVAASFGWFAFGSGNSRIIGYENTERSQQEFSFKGTFFGMHLRSTPKSFRGVLNDIIEAGEEEAQRQGAPRLASSLSKIY
jgi:hypothetical protein